MPLVNGKWLPLEVPKKIGKVLFDNSKKWRYRSLRGGRGAGKDWSVKYVIGERAVRQPIRVLFTRELQNSIKDSSHRLVSDTIARLGLNDYYTILENEIRGKNGSLFIFKGIRHNTEEIKSMEGIDLCVLDEAQTLTKESFDILDPTIRKAGSELWFLWNTRLDTDFIYEFCVKNPPDNLIGDIVNYVDNPYCPEELKIMAEYDRINNPSTFNNKWMGEPLTTGLFFTELGKHNKVAPFIVPDMDHNERLIGSLDHGIAHNTSFGMWYLSKEGYIYRVFTYSNNGHNTEYHAEAIADAIEGCDWSRHRYPCEIFYDYAMDTKHALNERVYRSDLDEYKDVFKRRGSSTIFTPANKRKIDGCNQMRKVFSGAMGVPVFQYFDGLNDPLIESLKIVETDKINPEVYAKMEGDDESDECRYGVMGAVVKMEALNRVSSKPRQSVNAVLRRLETMNRYSETGLV